MLQAALNGARELAEHPALPFTPDQLAADARAVRIAGADELHVHPRDAAGNESLHPAIVAPALAAIRAAAPGMPVGVSTGAWIEPGRERLLAHVRAWAQLPPGERPDYASVNCGEPGALDVMAALTAGGIGIEAGIVDPAGVHVLAASPSVGRVVRVLVEPSEADPAGAVAQVRSIEQALAKARITAPRLHHGIGPATWLVIAAAPERHVDVRIGLEDVLTLPDGTSAAGNSELVAALSRAVYRARAARRRPAP